MIKMNKKKSLIPLLIFVLAFVIGFNIYGGYYYIENIYKFNLGVINKNNIEKVTESNVWETIEKHYSDTLGMDISTYEKIYNTHSACDYIDGLLKPYYSQYGYDSVLASGMLSKYKIANVYSYEKCSEIIGESKINKEGLLKYLKKLSIDEKNYTSSKSEKNYINYAKNRLNLAIALLSGSTDTDMITKHSESDTYCWISNGLRSRTRIRFCHKGDYITATNYYISPDAHIEFTNKNCIRITSNDTYAVLIDDDIIMYNINYQLNKYSQEIFYCAYAIDEITFSGLTVSGKCHCIDIDNDTRTFSFDLRSGKMEFGNV